MVSRFCYEIYPETRQLPEIGSYIGYGLRCLALFTSGQKMEASELDRAADVTTDRKFAEGLAARFEEGQADPIHLYDLLEDLL